ncbi:MAG: tetratricopeptide repeat protein [Syntrophomonadaceae bacterium]
MNDKLADAQHETASLTKESWQIDLESAIDLHQKGVQGDVEAVKEAYSLLKKIRSAVPDNNLVEAYYGSVTTLLGRDELDPLERIKKVNKGLKILDRVINKDPENIDIRLLRGNICFRLPEPFFHRTASAIEDFSYLISCYEQDPSIFSPNLYRQLLQDQATAYQTINKQDEAEKTLNKLKALPEYGLEDVKPVNPVTSDDNPQISNMSGYDDQEEEDKHVSVKPAKKKSRSGKKGGVPAEGIDLYHKALKGDPEAAGEAEEFFLEALEKDPDNVLLKAYHADAMSLAGRYALDTFGMFGGAIKAGKAFDSILEEKPNQIEVRFLRAYHSFRLPEGFFKRTQKCIEDFNFLIQKYEQNKARFPKEAYWQLLFDLGIAYERLNMNQHANQVWEKLLSKRPPQKYINMVKIKKSQEAISLPRNLSLSNREAYLREAKRLHNLGAAGNKKAAKLAYELWQTAYEKLPDDYIVQAYYGASLALIGRDSQDPQLMFGNGLKGLKLIKEALSHERSNPEILRLKAMLLYSLPEAFFHFTSQAIKDFQALVRAYQKDSNIFTQEEYEEILYTLAMAHKRVGNKEQAKKVWAQLQAQSSNPRYKSYS